MSTRKWVKFNFYRCYVTDLKSESDKGKLYDFLGLAKFVENLSLEQLTVKLKTGDSARLEKVDSKKDPYWIFNFVKLRTTAIPAIVKEGREMRDIPLEDDEYPGEDITIVFDTRSKAVMLQRNKYSITPDQLCEYLEKIMKEQMVSFELRPIIVQNTRETLKKAKNIRRFSLRLDDCSEDQRTSESIGSLINQLRHRFAGKNLVLSIGSGYNKEGGLHKQEVEGLVDLLADDPACKQLIVAYKETEDSKVEAVDLVNSLLVAFIDFYLEPKARLTSEYASERMVSKFEDLYLHIAR